MEAGRILVGHWFDRLTLATEQREIRHKLSEQGKLPHQKLLRLKYAFNKLVTLPTTPCDFIKFGQFVQLHAPEIADLSNRLEATRGCPDDKLPKNPRQYGLVLAAAISPDEIIAETNEIGSGCPVSCSPFREPAARNVFVIEEVENCRWRSGEYLTFGQEFCLRLVNGSEILYLRSETPLIDGQFGPNYHNILRLEDAKDCYAKWRVVHWNRHQRFETEGAPIPPCMRVVIQHVMTGQCLAVENRNWYFSLLGYECGASVYTYRDVHRNETSECIWNFLTRSSY